MKCLCTVLRLPHHLPSMQHLPSLDNKKYSEYKSPVQWISILAYMASSSLKFSRYTDDVIIDISSVDPSASLQINFHHISFLEKVWIQAGCCKCRIF